MKTYKYEGGIPYVVEVPDPDPRQMAAFERFLDSIPCTCRGEAHDECRPCHECGELGALNYCQDDPDGGGFYLCDECYEYAVEAEEQAYRESQAEDRWQQQYEDMREDHEAYMADLARQREKEEWS